MSAYTIPPDSIVAGNPGHVGHHNNISDDLTTLVSHATDALNVTAAAYGADPTGATFSDSAFASWETALVAGGVPGYIPAGTYKISAALNWKHAGLTIIGDGAQSTKIIQHTANTPVVAVAGQQQRISGLTLGYASQEASGNTSSICLQFGDDSVGDCFESRFSDLVLYLGAYGMRINPALVASAGMFSCLLEDIRILGWSVSAINLDAAAGTGFSNCTGCVFNNTYLHNNNGGSPANSLLQAVVMKSWDEFVFNQLNVEHTNMFNTDLINITLCGAGVINSLHLEAIQLSGSGGTSGYFSVGGSSQVIVNGMSVRFSTLTGSVDNPVFRFFGNGSGAALTGFNEASDVTVGGAGVHPWADFGSCTDVTLSVEAIAQAQVNSNYLNVGTGCRLQMGNAPLSVAGAATGAVAETFPRRQATAASSALSSGTLYVTQIQMAKGYVISDLTMFTNTTVKTGGTHGWYVVLDSARGVVAVTADQTDAATVWGAASTAYPLAVTAAVLAPYDGDYYFGVMVAESGGTMPTFTCAATPATGINGGTPILSASSSTGQTTPPAVGATMGALVSVSGVQFYGYVS